MPRRQNLPGRFIGHEAPAQPGDPPGRPYRLSIVLFFFFGAFAFADKPLMTLSVESTILSWMDDFVLTLTVYNSPEDGMPEVEIDGLDQFELQGTGKNLLQVPRGKTQKWILTYTLTAREEGTFKLGPAATTVKGRRYYSNTLFLTVQPPPGKRQAQPSAGTVPEPLAPAEKEPKQKEPPKQGVEPTEKETSRQEKEKEKSAALETPLVLSASEIGEKIIVTMETTKTRPYRSEAVPVTLRLLTQLPVENLRFKDEADFPGFLKYDFPFTKNPKAEKIKHKNSLYAAYDLLRFLIFPLQDGAIVIPPFSCELKVRVPSGAYAGADLLLDLDRSSNSLALQVRPIPSGAVVGEFLLKNEIVSDAPQSKIIRLILEGNGQLSTFDFPEFQGTDYTVQNLSSTTQASISGTELQSRKVRELEILPAGRTTSIVLPSLKISQFDPSSRHLSVLTLPALPLRFHPQGPAAIPQKPFPEFREESGRIAFLLLLLLTVALLIRSLRPVPKKRVLRLHPLFSRKNPKLSISKSAARVLYQQIALRIAEQDGEGKSLVETLRLHLPQEDWLSVERAFRKLQSAAFSQTRGMQITYGELKNICERLERRWQP